MLALLGAIPVVSTNTSIKGIAKYAQLEPYRHLILLEHTLAKQRSPVTKLTWSFCIPNARLESVR
jgi:hypothetical protein